MVEIPDSLQSLFTGTVEERNGRYYIEVPKSEIEHDAARPGQTYRVAVLPDRNDNDGATGGAETPTREQPVETEEGTLYVDFGDQHRGKDAPWYPVYRSEDGSRRFGWYCEHCGSVDNAMDTLERVACNGCGNIRKAERWDAAYL
jgi:hypothetical protein